MLKGAIIMAFLLIDVVFASDDIYRNIERGPVEEIVNAYNDSLEKDNKKDYISEFDNESSMVVYVPAPNYYSTFQKTQSFLSIGFNGGNADYPYDQYYLVPVKTADNEKCLAKLKQDGISNRYKELTLVRGPELETFYYVDDDAYEELKEITANAGKKGDDGIYFYFDELKMTLAYFEESQIIIPFFNKKYTDTELEAKKIYSKDEFEKVLSVIKSEIELQSNDAKEESHSNKVIIIVSVVIGILIIAGGYVIAVVKGKRSHKKEA